MTVRDWLAGGETRGSGAAAAASSSKPAVAVASSPSSTSSGSDSGVDMLLMGVLGLLLLPALFRRIRSTSDGRGFKVGRGCKPSIQYSSYRFNPRNDWLGIEMRVATVPWDLCA